MIHSKAVKCVQTLHNPFSSSSFCIVRLNRDELLKYFVLQGSFLYKKFSVSFSSSHLSACTNLSCVLGCSMHLKGCQ